MYKLYSWLNNRFEMYFNEGLSFLDIGAYHGDFTDKILSNPKFTKAYLFEPNNKHFNFLKNKYANNNQIKLCDFALGNENTSKIFNCSQDDATGSILQYDSKYHHENSHKTVEYFSVEVKTLDSLQEQYFSNEKISLIKIDTQGFDLEVLKGATNLIRKHQPWLVIELNFLPFYASQAPVNLLFNWLAEAGYCLGGFFNDHYSGDQWLGFADGVFIPENLIDRVLEPFTTRPNMDFLIEENVKLKSICEERLALINTINHEAEKRLETINALNELLAQQTQLLQQKTKKRKWYQI